MIITSITSCAKSSFIVPVLNYVCKGGGEGGGVDGKGAIVAL